MVAPTCAWLLLAHTSHGHPRHKAGAAGAERRAFRCGRRGLLSVRITARRRRGLRLNGLDLCPVFDAGVVPNDAVVREFQPFL